MTRPSPRTGAEAAGTPSAAEAEVEPLERGPSAARWPRWPKQGLRDDVQTTHRRARPGRQPGLQARGLPSADLAELSPRGQRVVDTLAPVLAGLTDQLGSTATPTRSAVKPKYYPTDWDLSSARAITVLRRLNEVGSACRAATLAVGVRPRPSR